MYDILLGGLNSQQAVARQGLLEDAASRGVLRSTLPVDTQTQLAGATLAERGKLGAQQAQEVSGIRTQLGQLGIQKVTAIQDLAQALQDAHDRRVQANLAIRQARMQLRAAQAASAGRGGGSGGGGGYSRGGGSGGYVSTRDLTGSASQGVMAAFGQKGAIGGDGFANPVVWNKLKNEWMGLGLDPGEFDQRWGNLVNPANAQHANWGHYNIGR